MPQNHPWPKALELHPAGDEALTRLVELGSGLLRGVRDAAWWILGASPARIRAMVDRRLVRMIQLLLGRARAQLDTRISGAPSEAFALACIARCSDLLEGLLILNQAGQWSVARILGRTLVEFWLYGQWFLLDGDAAVERLLGEDSRHQGTQELGRQRVWDRLESKRQGGIDPRTGYSQPDDAQRQQLDVLARRVGELREQRGYGGGLPEVRYEMSYRWDSVHDVHPTFDLLTRYFRAEGNDGPRVTATPEVLGDRDLTASVNDDLRSDAMLVGDLLGLYLHVKGYDSEVQALETALADAAEA